MSKKSTDHGKRPGHYWGVSVAFALSIASLAPATGNAYTAAGDRNFPANLVIPQIAPMDAFWGSASTQPVAGGDQTQFAGTYSKLITERLGIQLSDGITGIGAEYGAQNFTALLQYEMIINQTHEFVLSAEIDHEFGGTGSEHVGSPPQSATRFGLTFGKGLGDLPIGYWRPLAITGFVGYQAAEAARPKTVNTGFSIQYSVPYLLSKVANIDLPPFIRSMTPMTEIQFNIPAANNSGRGRALVIAPGVSYNEGTGWEFGIEAMIPAAKASGRGVGVVGQLVIQLDYLLSDSILGRPIFVPH
jgi:hypothetical protein